MTASQIIFYILSAFILGTAVLSVTTRKIFRSAIWLLFSLIGVAGLYFWMEVEFIAAVQIVVYVGVSWCLLSFPVSHAAVRRSNGQSTRCKKDRSSAGSNFGFALTYMLVQQNGFEATGETFDWSVEKK